MKQKPNIAKSWDRVSDSWQKRIEPLFLRKDLLWGPYGPWESDAKLISPVKNKKVLVAGCGSGPDVWWLATNGARVTGIDVSPKQLKSAEERMRKSNLKAVFIQKDLDKLQRTQFVNKSFDLVVSNYAFQYVRDLLRLFKVLSSFLRPKGEFVFSLDHPVSCAIEGKTKLRVDYLNERIQYWSFRDWNASTRTIPAYSYHRTASAIYNALVDAGFSVGRIIEPKPTMKGGIGNSREYKKAQRIPETIIFQCIKK